MPITISGSTGIAGVDGSASTPAVQGTDTNTGIVFPAADTVAVATNGTEQMRVDSSGNLLVGVTTANYGSTANAIQLLPATALICSKSTTATTNMIVFNNGNGQVGFINTSGTTTTYSTSSDYRLKYDVRPMIDGLAKVIALKPSVYKWNADGSNGEGFIAHELQSVIPSAVSGEKDAVNEDGSIKPQGVDYSKIVVHLVAAIQEQQTHIATLEARLAALEAK